METFYKVFHIEILLKHEILKDHQTQIRAAKEIVVKGKKIKLRTKLLTKNKHRYDQSAYKRQ